ncbi:hypothetical protein MKA31_12340 [[Clostridium] innocuum]|uniref:hypothetical protein n=1 Tax=Clostridium innocuum TaxID=1522 RepID=UPI002147C3D5|nr:hypothetical protein [[Clostridium] innocuum]MCR0146237.1 hypothetical protein [[Clostridium] innocuum]MCR0272870.1 hypothetical protein [[Clostridium] innocuum]MCR0634175.1 hypothetical protein [[Clostridium] innocuum]
MDIQKLKAEYGKTKLLKEEIIAAQQKYQKKKEEAENRLKPGLAWWKNRIIKEIDTFFMTNGFEKADERLRYEYADIAIEIEIIADRLPLRIELTIPQKNMRRIIEVRPREKGQCFYYGEKPGQRVKITVFGKEELFSIHALDVVENERELNKVLEDHRKVLKKIEHTILHFSEEIPYEFCLKDHDGKQVTADTFQEIFEHIE